MSAKTILIIAIFLTFRAVAQDTPKSQALCTFADGKTIRITHFSGRVGSALLATDESFLTANGTSLPAGEYIVSPVQDSHHNWTLTFTEKTGKGGSSRLSPVPMSATTSNSPFENSKLSFDQKGAGCMMHWGIEKSNVLLSLEFTERNADMPLLQ